jgi:hypothetical protein
MEPDLLKRAAAPVRELLAGWLVAAVPALPAATAATLLDLVGLVVVAALVLVVGTGHAAVARRPRAGHTIAAGLRVASGVAAVALFAWIVGHPSPVFEGLFARWDHLAFCALAGLSVAAATLPWRMGLLIAVSVPILLQYAGGTAVAVVAGAGLLGVAVLRTPLAARPWRLALVQGVIITAAYGCAIAVRRTSLLAGLQVQALLAFAALRHISFTVEAAKRPRSLREYLVFMAFYPGVFGIFGAPEVFTEFARRNLVRAPALDHRRAARRVLEGTLQAGASMLIPISVEDVIASPGPLVAWPLAVVFFVRTALAVMGAWAIIDAVALLYGIQLRGNFRGLLSCENPSELWHAWRGTLTNWLIQHVYAPLGASQRHETFNLFAAFGVSLLWHALGVPFITPAFRLAHLLPVMLWAAINAVAVVLHVKLHRAGVLRRPAPGIRRGGRLVLTWALGALTPLLLQFQGADFARFPALIRALTGMPL